MKKRVELTLATKRALWIFCEAPREVTTSIAQKFNELYDCFHLVEAEDAIDRIEALKKAAAKAAGEPVDEVIVTWKELLAVPGEEEYEIDETYIKWLSTELGTHNWARVLVRGMEGFQEENTPINMHQHRAIALLGRAVDSATEVK